MRTGLFCCAEGWFANEDDRWLRLPSFSPDALFRQDDPRDWLTRQLVATAAECDPPDLAMPLSPPIGSQEIWAAGVTYYRSRSARMEEAEGAGGDVFYDRVYEADRPELFFKATAGRARGHLDTVCIRNDSAWNVPEPELTLAISAKGQVFGYTIGNDMSSRSIEGENPLYLPQAKVYTGSCAIGPALWVGDPPAPETGIHLEILRSERAAFSGRTQVSQIKRRFDDLAGWLFRDNEFPAGACLMTGTGIVPESDFTLRTGDEVRIQIEGLGELRNPVAQVNGAPPNC